MSSPDVSPESAAGSSVVVNRGYKEDQYAVSWMVILEVQGFPLTATLLAVGTNVKSVIGYE